jgi:hypothetical protein
MSIDESGAGRKIRATEISTSQRAWTEDLESQPSRQNAFRFASSTFSASNAMAGLSGIGPLLVQMAGFREMLSPLSNAFSISSCLTATSRRFSYLAFEILKSLGARLTPLRRSCEHLMKIENFVALPRHS